MGTAWLWSAATADTDLFLARVTLPVCLLNKAAESQNLMLMCH